MVDAARRAERRELLEVADGEVGELLEAVGDEGGDVRGLVEADDEDLAEAGDGGEALDVVLERGDARDGEERLRALQRQRPEPRPSIPPFLLSHLHITQREAR